MSQNFFKPVESKPDFSKLEKQLLSWWYESGLVKKYLHKNDKQKKTFSFMDGPITANNPMGVHHGWGRTFKDLWQRYNNMQGKAGRFQNGFDCQGLWVEVEVEKELGFKSKKDIEKFGIAKFVNLCKKRVLKFAKIQTEQSKRLGYFADWNNSYFTMSDENNYMIWHFLKKCWQNKWLYKGRDSVPWCPRCGTAISQHEMLTEDYKQVTHESIYFKLPIIDKGWENNYFLVWTTTPWTIPANVALVVDPKINYLLINQNNQILIVSEKRAKVLFPNLDKKDCRKIKGKKLIDLKYQGPYDHLGRVKKALKNYQHKVVASDPLILPVDETEGTGMVHIATGGGTEDYQLGKKEKLPVIEVIDEEANYLNEMGDLSGKNAKENPELILDFLRVKEEGRFFYKTQQITHSYPACWRCKKELVWRVVDEWYINMDKIDPNDKKKRTLRKKMITVVKKINWMPKFGLKRELDWLNNMHDWLISKKRYWGLALPIWECQCGWFEVIGSKEELKQRAVNGWNNFSSNSPHRPWVDEVKIRCSKCGKLASRVPDVGNPWLDAGIVSFSTLIDPKTKKISYITDKKYFNRWFPADFITESFPGQFKNWFYSMIAMSTVLEDKPSYKTVLGFGTLLGEDSRPMHKSWGNAIEFNQGADKIGADVMRWMYVNHDPAKNLLFGYKIADETRRKFHLILWNIFRFFVNYANLKYWKPKDNSIKKSKALDCWILSRMNLLINRVTMALDKYDSFTAAESLESFVLDLSNWYVRRSRERINLMSQDKDDTDNCFAVLYQVLITLSKLLAPFTPFIAEKIFKTLTKHESVHLQDWPKSEKLSKIDQDLIEQMEIIRKVCELGNAARKKEGIKVRQPLSKIEVKSTDLKASLSKSVWKNDLVQLIKDELNIKNVVFSDGKEIEIKLDTKITPRLVKEGQAREIIRQIQEARKKADCQLDQLVIVYLPFWPKEHEDDIKKKALVKDIKKGKTVQIVKC